MFDVAHNNNFCTHVSIITAFYACIFLFFSVRLNALRYIFPCFPLCIEECYFCKKQDNFIYKYYFPHKAVGFQRFSNWQAVSLLDILIFPNSSGCSQSDFLQPQARDIYFALGILLLPFKFKLSLLGFFCKSSLKELRTDSAAYI